MKKPILLIFTILAMAWRLYGQQSPVFTHYAFNRSYWNPALTAEDRVSNVMFVSRGQWLGYDSSFGGESAAPATQYFNYSSLSQFGENLVGLGGTIIYDELGPIRDIEIDLSLAYHMDFARGALSFGVSPRLVNKTLNSSALVAVDPTDLEDVSGKISEVKLDLAVGIAYKANDYSIALGLNNLLRPDYDRVLGTTDELGKERYEVNLIVDYNYVLTYKTTITPMLLFRSDFLTWTYDIGVKAMYQKKAWLGLSYRASEAISVLVGYSLLNDNKLSVGYSFDLVVDKQYAKEPTSHEIYIRYNLPTIDSRSKKIVRTPRFRF